MNVDVLVLGGNLPGVVTALECAKLGLKVAMVFTELEISDALVTDAQGGWAYLLDELELAAPVPAPTHPAFVRNVKGQPAEVLPESWLGIPSSPLAAEVATCIGQSAATRAYLDRIKPVLTIGKERHLAALVSKRMGPAVLKTLVEPFVYRQFGTDAAHVDVALAAPGLNEAITRTGSLSTGVLATYAALTEHHRTFVLPSSTQLAAAIRKRLEFWSVQVVDAHPDEFALDDDTLTYRSLVLAASPELADRVIDLSDFGLTELAARVTMSVTLACDAPVGFVGLGAAPQGDVWSVEVVGQDGNIRMLSLGGPRSSWSLDHIAMPHELSEAAVLDVLMDAGVDFAGEPELGKATLNYATFATLEEEHAREGICDELDALDTQRVVGSWLHQGDESKAIVAAQAGAQSLRRQLLGLK